jgi:hypothetical protein
MSLAADRLRVGVFVVLVPASVAACSFLVDLDGYTGGTDAGVTTIRDAASDAIAADGSKGGGDASIDSPWGNADGAPDAAQDSPSLGFCASKSPAPLFCDDFDTRSLAVAWDFLGNAGGTPVHDSTTSTSAPSSLLIPISALAANANVYSVTAKQFPQFIGRPMHGEFGFQVRVDAIDIAHASDGIIAVFQTVDNSGSRNWSIQLSASYSAGNVALLLVEYETANDGGANLYQEAALNKQIGLKEWHSIRMTFSLPVVPGLPGGANTASIYLDGVVAASLTLKAPVLPFPPEIDLGSTYIATPSDAWTLRYDDAFCNIVSP